LAFPPAPYTFGFMPQPKKYFAPYLGIKLLEEKFKGEV